MRALASGKDADKVSTLVRYLQSYPPKTNHPIYNPFPDSPGIGTGGTLTLDEASTYAGRTLTNDDLATINQNTSCNSCHDGTTQNPLRAPFGQTVQFLTANGIMPPNRGIVDSSARTEAIKVLTAAYKVKLKTYFTVK
jgi:cytochrome c551/c552